ncbi:MAG: hypothetical protein COC15_04300 [Legionellales bacterium]|nr:MAG: hypothetical protein COC15_04300 [Legionellales bacterium]
MQNITIRYVLGCNIAKKCKDTHVVCIGDREADIYELYDDAERMQREHKSDWLIRLKNNRVILDEDLKRKHKIVDELSNAPVLGEIEFTLPKRGNARSGGEPGPKTLWIGLPKITNIIKHLEHCRDIVVNTNI